MKTQPMYRAERGFSLVETMVAVLVGGIVFGAAMQLFVDNWRTYHTQTQISEMRSNARNAMEFLTRDLMPAGYGLRQAEVTVSPVIANEPTNLADFSATAVTVRYNYDDVWTRLSDPMPAPSSELKVEETDGFVEGGRILIWDDTGTWDWLLVTEVQPAASHLQHNTTDCSKSYSPDDSTIVAAINEISFRYDAANLRLERQQDAGSWSTVAENVEQIRFRYFDRDNTEITPNTDDLRRSVRKIAVTLRVRTAELDRRTNRFYTFSMQTEITPRNLMMWKDAV